MKGYCLPHIFIPFFSLAWILLFSLPVFAHCDGLDGPVISAAKKALETGNVNLVLIWVQKKDEADIKKAFEKSLAVRKLSPQAKETADMYFFESLVRIHRAGEGAPYTGLKPAGRDLGPAIASGDKAVETGKVESLQKLLLHTVEEGLQEKFNKLMAKKNFKPDDVEAGRKYIEAYVDYIHYVERLYEASRSSSHGHFTEHEEGGARHHD